MNGKTWDLWDKCVIFFTVRQQNYRHTVLYIRYESGFNLIVIVYGLSSKKIIC